jgi:hypothetical protein
VAGKGAQEKCGTLVTGMTPNRVEWPDELARLTRVSFHVPPSADGNWLTWVAGIEYVDEKPYVAALVQYH